MADVPTMPWSVRVARRLRSDMTEPEVRLWSVLRQGPWKFRRQQPIGAYICDFVCFPKRLIVEVDGAHHAESRTDRQRDAYLADQGFKVLRVWNTDVMTNLPQVLDQIGTALDERPDRHRNRSSCRKD